MPTNECASHLMCCINSMVSQAKAINQQGQFVTMISADCGCMSSYKKWGRQIVRRQSPQEPGNCNRLWKEADICHALSQSTSKCSETDVVEPSYLIALTTKRCMLVLKPFLIGPIRLHKSTKFRGDDF
ncbi:uncharacterized protein LOC102621470 isoform X2 [Citrus sinensis]|uniref:uncharacterized protein LOC102621470 isoform X2 n=1 Tax=Citrus sinensis TaxID=2711 RepID=UPI0022792D94|nr:uncharacterized protein LOC102621470 isoform X2 [Citrus sinensis]